MTGFLLLTLLLVKGYVDPSEVRGCPEGWVEFTCKYPQTNGKYQIIDVVNPRGETIQSTQKDVWEDKGKFSLCHDMKIKVLRVPIKHLTHDDSGDYYCNFQEESDSSVEQELELDSDNRGCQKQSNQTAYREAKTTITCDYPENDDKSDFKFFCKEIGSSCEDILSTKSSPGSNGRFTLMETTSGFSISINNVSPHDAGVYWCGLTLTDTNHCVALRRIQLEVQVGSWLTGVVITIACVAVLVIIWVLYQRFECLKNSRHGGPQNKKEEDYGYAEIQEHPPKPDSGTAPKTVYVTANFPTNPSALMHFSEVQYHNTSSKVSGDTYSAVMDKGQCPTSSTVSDPSRCSEVPIYATVKKPQHQ